jgi:hypothetical protein
VSGGSGVADAVASGVGVRDGVGVVVVVPEHAETRSIAPPTRQRRGERS